MPRGEATAVKRDLKRRHRPGDPGTQLEVEVRCDPLGDRIAEVSVEQGTAHGWALSMWRLVRDGDAFRATRVDFTGRYNAGDPQTYDVASRFDVELRRGEVDAARVESALYRVRASLLAAGREIAGPGAGAATGTAASTAAGTPVVTGTGPAVGAPTSPVGTGRSSWATSHSFVTAVRLVDAEGRALERWFAGNEEAGAQPEYLPIQLAEAALAPVLETVALEPSQPGAADRAFFSQRFTAVRATFDDPRMPPWTRQAYVALAGPLGSASIVPVLIDLARADRDPRTRHHAANALAALTGWDARLDDTRRPRPPAEVAAD